MGERAPWFGRTETLFENAETFLYIADIFGPYLCTAMHMSQFCIYKRRALANEQWSLYNIQTLYKTGY